MTPHKWLYAMGDRSPVKHALRADIRNLAECGARGPFYPRAAGEPVVCRTCSRIIREHFPDEVKAKAFSRG